MSDQLKPRGEETTLCPWATPSLTAFDVEDVTAGDPTISDDGLGDGLFS